MRGAKIRGMRSIREIIQGATLVALMVTATLYAVPTVMAPADELDSTNPIASKYGVSIVWTNDWRNCEASADPNAHGGCWHSITPDVIYVAKGASQSVERFMIFHEVMHVIQYRKGLPLNECAADRFAASHVNVGESYTSNYSCATSSK